MAEDAQPNDLRGRSVPSTSIPSIRSAGRTFTASRDHLPPTRMSVKRPLDRSSAGSPAKRRRLSRKEIVRELPPTCHKGVHGCNRQRKEFLALEIQRLQQSQPGLYGLTHRMSDTAIHFSYLQTNHDVLNCSLAPGIEPVNRPPPNERSQPKVEPRPQLLPALNPIISTIPGPPRIFKSGTLSFTPPPIPMADDTLREPPVIPRKSRVLDADREYTVPVAELMFGKQGPPKLVKPLKSTITETSVFVAPVNDTLVSHCGSLIEPHPRQIQPQTQTTASNLQSSLPSNKAVKAQIAGKVLSSESSNTISSSGNPYIPSNSHGLESAPSKEDFVYGPDGDELLIPVRKQHDKLRRLLPSTPHSPSVIVSMYGGLEVLNVASRKHWLIAQDPSPTKEAVDDACLVTYGSRSIAVFGHSRDKQQLSFIDTNDINNGIVSAIDLKRPWNSAKKGGVSAVAPMLHPLMFASGGYDHCVHLWTLKDDFSSASPEKLNITHTSQVQSLLAIHDTSHKLISAGADCNVHSWDLSSERIVSTIKTSNSVYHAHLTTSPFCTLLELAHRELQFEIRDHRLIPTIPVQRFGYIGLQPHGRYMKGASLSNCFASGDRVGNVCLWDLRSTNKPSAQIECFNNQKIAHLVFQSSRLIACSENNQIRLVKYDQPI
ncbi:hypothetical protein C8R43DRAFT_970536 [Mycena crocata]|nr:hypothetical protein C8R43DRAFT_970536 [Mycena crocata]